MTTSLLKGTAYITGAASGLGKATAFNFAKHGISNLALSDFNHDALLAVAEGIKAQYPHVEVETMVVDVTDTKGVNVSVEQTVKRFGRIDIGVNFAGIIGAGTRTTDDDAEADWMRVVDVNLHGVFRCERALLRAMMKQEDLGPREGRGNIINMASMFGVVGLPADLEGPSYGAAKHGVVGLTKSDATSYAKHKIRINALCPGYTDTPLLKDAKEGLVSGGEIGKVPMGRFGHVDEIADCAVFMASPMASFMTGSSLVVDGGYSCC